MKMKYRTEFHETARKHSKIKTVQDMISKVCRIEALKKVGNYKLTVDGISTKFKGTHAANYFHKHYAKLGYKIESYFKYEEPEYDMYSIPAEDYKIVLCDYGMPYDPSLQELKDTMSKIANKHVVIEDGEAVIPSHLQDSIASKHLLLNLNIEEE